MAGRKEALKPMAEKLLIRCYPELKQLIENAALTQDLVGGMGEYAVRILAEHFGRPDLGKVPRAKRGPKSKRSRMQPA